MLGYKTVLTALLLCVCGYASGVNPTAMGWSSKNTFALNINEDIIKSQADAMVAAGLDSAGYTYINLDDGFWDGRDKQGNLRLNTKLFPGGMRPLVDYIHSKGLTAGIYSDAGRNSCGSQNKHKWGIDVGMAGHEAEDCKLYFLDWDFDYIKVDFCGGERLHLDERRQYTKIGRAIKNCGKPGVVYNICCRAYPGTWVSEVADSWRTTGDIDCNWETIKDIILENLFIQAYTGDGHYNDMDVLEIGKALSRDEENTHFAYWCIASSPLLIGCDLTNIPESSLRLLKNPYLISMNQDTLGLGAPVAQKQGEVYVVAKDMEKRNGPKRAVVIMNLSDETQSIDVDLARAGFSGTVRVFDCLEGEMLPGPVKQMQGVEIPPHGSKAYFITGARNEKEYYQAEEAFLPAYQELGKTESPTWVFDDNADGGAYVTGLGASKENAIVWNNVYSRTGGMYTLVIRYSSAKPTEMFVDVNGRQMKRFSNLSTRGSEDGWGEVTLRVPLQRGDNKVVLYNNVAKMPDIDYLRLVGTSRANAK